MLLFIIYTLLCFATLAYSQDDTRCTKEQENQEACLAMPFYRSYQKVTCLEKKTIEKISGGKDSCDNRNTKYCWYESCQKRLTSYGFYPEIRDQCKCPETSYNRCKHKLDHNKKRCMKLRSYDEHQKVTCLHTREVLLKAFSGCPFPETHCWYSCQAEKHGAANGRVSDECRCSAAGLQLAPIIGGYTCIMILVILLELY